MAFIEPNDDVPLQTVLGQKLVEAAAHGDMHIVTNLLMQGVDCRFDNSRALRRAATNGHVDIVDALIERGAQVNAQGGEALRYAVVGGHVAVARALLTAKADPNVMDGEPLIKAAQKGDVDMTLALLGAGAAPHYSDHQSLRISSFHGHLIVVELLLSAGADPFAFGSSALALAAAQQHDGIKNILMSSMDQRRAQFADDLQLAADKPAFLRAPYRDDVEPAIIRAIKMEKLPEALAAFKSAGGILTVHDLDKCRDRSERTLLSLAADRGQIMALFDTALWRCDMAEMKKGWDLIPKDWFAKKRVDENAFAAIMAQQVQKTLKSKAGKFKL